MNAANRLTPHKPSPSAFCSSVRGIKVMLDADLAELYGMPTPHKELAARLDALERKVGSHDPAIAGLIDAIRQLTQEPARSSRPIGFTADLGKSRSK